MLTWIFGPVVENVVHLHTHDRAAGFLQLERARVRWFLSISPETLPPSATEQGKRTFRSITVDGTSVEFSEGFTDLHTVSYQEILNGNGFGLDVVLPSIGIAQQIRDLKPVGLEGEFHPLAALPLRAHPFKRVG